MLMVWLFQERKKEKKLWLVTSESQKEDIFNFLVFLQIKEEIRYHLHSKVSKQREIKK